MLRRVSAEGERRRRSGERDGRMKRPSDGLSRERHREQERADDPKSERARPALQTPTSVRMPNRDLNPSRWHRRRAAQVRRARVNAGRATHSRAPGLARWQGPLPEARAQRNL